LERGQCFSVRRGTDLWGSLLDTPVKAYYPSRIAGRSKDPPPPAGTLPLASSHSSSSKQP